MIMEQQLMKIFIYTPNDSTHNVFLNIRVNITNSLT